MTVAVGDTAPEFCLPSTGTRPRLVRLGDAVAAGTPLLVFPGGDGETPLSLASLDWFSLVDGLRPLFVAAPEWARRRHRWEATDTPVLADVDGRTAAAYGVDEPACHAFLVDGTRTVRGRWRAETVSDLDFPALLEAAKRHATTTRQRPESQLSP